MIHIEDGVEGGDHLARELSSKKLEQQTAVTFVAESLDAILYQCNVLALFGRAEKV